MYAVPDHNTVVILPRRFTVNFWNPQMKLGETGGDPVPDMNERNDTNGSHHHQEKEA